MTGTSTEDRAEFRAVVRQFLTDRSPEAAVRALLDDAAGFDPQVWTVLADQLGLAGLLVPEEHGGQGLTFAEAAVALGETGRALYGGPFLGSAVLATSALLAVGDDPAVKELLPGLAAGTTIAALALDDDAAAPVRADAGAEGWRLTGRKRHVPDAVAAGRLVVAAALGGGVGLFLVDAAAPGVAVRPVTSLDLTRRFADVELSAAPARRLGEDVTAALAGLHDLGAIACAAEQAGIAARCLELAVEYALTREQFGRSIGSFQAIKHRLAEQLARVEQMSAAVTAAAAAVGDGPAVELTSVVKAWCGEEGARVVEALIDTLGGIGFTWEHVAHLYLRRMKTLEQLFGSPDAHRDRLAAELGLAG